MDMYHLLDIHAENCYGYPFHGDTIAVIYMDDQKAQEIMNATKGSRPFPFICTFQDQKNPVSSFPSYIYIKTKESYYLLRCADPRIPENRQGISFTIYHVKPLYMATADLLNYQMTICTPLDQGYDFFLFTRK